MKKCDNFFKYLEFMYGILKNIEDKLEAESYIILKEINNIKKRSLDHKSLARQWLEKQNFNEDEKKLLLDFSKKIDSFLQNKKSQKKDLEEFYTHDEFLIYYRMTNHFKDIEKISLSLIIRFQIIDRMKQQLSHINYVLEEILKNQKLDKNGFPEFLELFDEKSHFFHQLKNMMNTTEEKDEFYRIFNIKIDENREDEIFEAF